MKMRARLLFFAVEASDAENSPERDEKPCNPERADDDQQDFERPQQHGQAAFWMAARFSKVMAGLRRFLPSATKVAQWRDGIDPLAFILQTAWRVTSSNSATFCGPPSSERTLVTVIM